MKLIATLVMLLALSACSLPVFFRVPVVQGNIVTADQVARLHEGMTKKQVAYVLGTPLIQSPFEADTWDYLFYYRNPRAHVRESKLKLYFVNGKLSDIEGDEEYTAQALKTSQQSSAIGAPLGNTSSRSISRNDQQKASDDDQNSAGTNPPESNRPVTNDNQLTPENPLPHEGPPLPGHSE